MAVALGNAGAMDQQGSPSDPFVLAFNNVAGDFLLVGIGSRTGGDQVTACTYAGVSMTLVAKFNSTAASTWIYVYKLAAPATGSNNISVSQSGSADIRVAGISYTGVSDINASATGTATATSYTATVTTVTDNSWVGAWTMNDTTDNKATGSNVMRTPTGGDGNGPGFLDSNAAKTPAGSYDVTGAAVGDPSAVFGWIVFAIAPPAAAGGTRDARELTLLGAG